MPAPSNESRSIPGRARFWVRGVVVAVVLLPLMFFAYSWITFPRDTTPEGAYLRVVRAVNEAKPDGLFAYTEEAAQHACFTIRDYRKKAIAEASGRYPAEEFDKLRAAYEPYARAEHGRDVFALIASEQGWMSQLRADVSGIAKIEQEGPRATIITVKGTRYSMRRRPGGIWGLTAFTATLVDEAERAARDLEQVEKAAADFERAAAAAPQRPASSLRAE